MTKIKTVSAIGRLGTESAFDVLARAADLERQGKRIINLGIGQPDFRTPDHVVEAARKALIDGHHGYTPANGILPLREAVAEDILKYREVEVDPDTVVIVPGGKVTMWHAILMFGEPGREIMYPNPGFPIYESAINYTGAKAIPIELDQSSNFAFDVEQLLSQITPRTSLVIINSPANPTGGVLPRDILDKLVEGLEKFPHVSILSDEIYSRITYDNAPFHSMMSYPSLKDRLILLDGWSKTYAMTGWRIGYAVWPKGLVETAVRLNINSISCTNAPTQFAAIAALQGPQDAVESMVVEFDNRRSVIFEELTTVPGFSIQKPDGAFYAFPNISGTCLSSSEMQDTLLGKLGVATISGTSFGTYGEGYLRFSYAASLENIQEAISGIRTYAENTNWCDQA